MHKPNEIFARLPESVLGSLFAHLHENEKPLYKAAIRSVADQKKLRPVFLERKPKAEQFKYIAAHLALARNSTLAAQVLQIWLVGAHSNLLCAFLDGLGIAHEDNGTIEELPEAPAKEKLIEVVSTLQKGFDPDLVKVYLHSFQSLDEAGWPTLAALLSEDPSLAL
jgi:hypothetical protein